MNAPIDQNAQMAEALKAQMADIILPPPVPAWPPAWGWWVLAGVMLAALIGLIIVWRQHQRKNRYRKTAITALNQANPSNLHEQVQSILTLTKACVLSAQPALRNQVASMSAELWLAWLNSKVKTPVFGEQECKLIAEFAYRPSDQAPSAELSKATEQWLRTHQLKEAQHA